MVEKRVKQRKDKTKKQNDEVSERLKEPALKTGDVKASGGSNPSLVAKRYVVGSSPTPV